MKSYQIWISFYLFMIYTLINLSIAHPLSLNKENGLLDIKNIDQIPCSESHAHIDNLIKGDQFNAVNLKEENKAVKPLPSGNHILRTNKKDGATERIEAVVTPKNKDLTAFQNGLEKDNQTKTGKSNTKEVTKTWLQKTLDLILLPYKSIKGILKWVGNRIHSLRSHLNEPNQNLVKDQREEKMMIKKINRCEFDEFKDELNLEKTHSNEVDEVEHTELIGSKGEGIIAAMRSRKKSASSQNSKLSKFSRPDDEIKTVITKENNKKENPLDEDERFPGFNFHREWKFMEENDELIRKPSKSFLVENIEKKPFPISTSTDQIKLSNLINQGKGLMRSTFGDDGYIKQYAKKCSNIFERFKGDNDDEMLRKDQEEKDLKKGLIPNQLQHLDQFHLTIDEPLINIHDEWNHLSLNIKLPMFKETKMNQYDDFLSILAKRYQFRLIEEDEKKHPVRGQAFGSRKEISIDVHTNQRPRTAGVLEHPSGVETGDPLSKEVIGNNPHGYHLSTILQSSNENRNTKGSSKSLIKLFHPSSLMATWKKHQKMRELDPLYAFMTLKKDLLRSKYRWFISKFNQENQSGRPFYKLKHLQDNQISEMKDLKINVKHESEHSDVMSEGFEKWYEPSSKQIPQSESLKSFSTTIGPMQNLFQKFGEIFKARVMKIKDTQVDLGLSKLKGNFKNHLTNIFKSKKAWFRGQDVVSEGRQSGYAREGLDEAKETIKRVLSYQERFDDQKDYKTFNEIVPHISQEGNSNKMEMITSKDRMFNWADALKLQRDTRDREVSNNLVLPLFDIFKEKTTWFSSEMNVWKLKVLKKVLHPHMLEREPMVFLTLTSPLVRKPKMRKISKGHLHQMKQVRVNRGLSLIQTSNEKKIPEENIEKEEQKVEDNKGDTMSVEEEKVEKEDQKVEHNKGDTTSDEEEEEDQNEGKMKSWQVSHPLSPIIKDRVEFFEKLKERNQ